MMSIKEKQQELIDDFAFLSDWEQKYEYIIDLGKELKGLPEEKKKEDKYFSCFFSEEPSILRIAVFFSKEIEHDEENIRQLLSYNPLSNICKKGV